MHASVQQAFADGATLDELEKHIAFLRSLGAPGDAHPMISFSDEDDHKPCKTDQPAREYDMQTVTLGAAKLQVTPKAWQTRTGASRAL